MKKFWFAGDTETTGFEAETNSIVEIAFVDQRGEWSHSLVNPTTPISFGAMATHHITLDMVRNAQDLPGALVLMGLGPTAISHMEADGIEPILVFHNAEFDRAFLPPHLQDLRYVCTWRCAVAMFPNAESHSNGALWYEFGLNRPMPEEAGSMPHRALFDALMTADLMKYMLKHVEEENPNIGDPLEHLIWLSQEPILLDTVRFGKHRGMKWKEVPYDYLQWCRRQDMDKDVLFTADFWMKEHSRG